MAFDLGRHVSNSWDDVIRYLYGCMDAHGSIRLSIHGSADFQPVGDDEGEVTTFHQHAYNFDQGGEILDIQRDDLDAILDDIRIYMETGDYYRISGSGWSIIPGTVLYHLVTSAYQPNGTPDNRPDGRHQNSIDPEQCDRSVTRDTHQGFNMPPTNLGEQIRDPFLVAMGCKFITWDAKFKTHLARANMEQIELWIEFQEFWWQAPITLSTLPNWHQQNGEKYQINIFNERGNLIYSRGRGEEVYIGIIGKKWYYIKDLLSWLNESEHRANKTFCKLCRKIHFKDKSCVTDVIAAKDGTINLPRKPKLGKYIKIYADFEAFASKDEHKVSGYCFIVIRNGKLFKTITKNIHNCNGDIVEDFIDTIYAYCTQAAYIDDCDSTPYCCICEQDIDMKPGSPKPIIGKNAINGDEGSHHQWCWKSLNNSIPVFFHNLKGYDSHYIMNVLANHPQLNISLSGKSIEKMDSIRVENKHGLSFRFLDTINHLLGSLAGLVKNVKEWKYTPVEWRTSKGSFPYEWFDSPAKLHDTSLPPKELWWNDLTNSHGDLDYAQKVWDQKGFTTFAQYHDFYLWLDTIQLADVFEEYSRACVKGTRYDPAYFQGAPSYTWFLGLVSSPNIEYDFPIVLDKDIYMDIQKNIRGGVSQCFQRHAEADGITSHMTYLDVNSLYSYCMMQKLPTKFVQKHEGEPFNWKNEKNHMFMMMVDLDYPVELHDRDYEYPLCPDHYWQRLMTSLHDKKNILLHSEMVKYYLSHGMILSRVHYCYEFEQGYPLKRYVEGNIKKRQAATSPAMSTLYKLLNNSIYGKTCENVFKYRRFAFRQPTEEANGAINEWMQDVKSHIPMGEQFLCEMKMGVIELNKPIQIGWCVLEWAKLQIYKLWMPMKKHFGDRVNILYTDTDSLLFHFNNTPDPFLEMSQVPEVWSQLDLEKHKTATVKTVKTDKVPGLWSDECDGKIPVEFVGLRSKCYALRFQDDSTKLKNKGVRAVATHNGRVIGFQNYLDALFKDEQVYVEQFILRSKHHHVKQIKQEKLALSSLDFKRFVTHDKIRTLPWGYKGERFRHLTNIVAARELELQRLYPNILKQ